MFRRRSRESATSEVISAAERLLRRQRANERSADALAGLAEQLGGEVRGYVVRGDDERGYAFDAQLGYDDALLTLVPQNGPWRAPGPRLISNIVSELFTANEPPMRSSLGSLGMREATSAMVVPVSGRYENYGALVLQRHSGPPFNEEDLRAAGRWAGVLGEVQSLALELQVAKLSLVEFTRAFVQSFEAQDFTQLGHAERVTAYSLALGRALELSRPQLGDLYFAAMLHDIGKLGSGFDLTIEDLDHPQRGANMVAGSDLLLKAAEGIRHHHEAWDGSGFPDGLRKDAIPLLARIVAIADTFDLLSSERGRALPMREVEKALEEASGQKLDPALVALFINILRQGKSTQELAELKESDLPF